MNPVIEAAKIKHKDDKAFLAVLDFISTSPVDEQKARAATMALVEAPLDETAAVLKALVLAFPEKSGSIIMLTRVIADLRALRNDPSYQNGDFT